VIDIQRHLTQSNNRTIH